MSVSAVDLKKTINLPKTDFSMKANLPTAEPKMLARWESEAIYHKIREVRKGKPTYVLHDGPPYANGNIHLGTAFNKVLKDFIVKSRSMAGYDAPYVPGWDCHGLPIEFKVDSTLGKRKATMSVAEIRAECRAYAAKFVDIHRREFKAGVFGRWRSVSDDERRVRSGDSPGVRGFSACRLCVQGLNPVHWCLKDQTALAEAEVEYEDHSSPSIYVRFKLKTDASAIDAALAGRDVYAVIWTTTPWTMPSNLAICFHPKYEYAAVDMAGGVMIVAEGLLDQLSETLGWDKTVVARFPGAKLEGMVFQHPFLERDSIGILGDYVTLDQGTGAVHTAPGHGQEDFVAGQRYGLPVYCPVDHAGRFFQDDAAPGKLPEELLGKTVWQANPLVVEILERHGALLKQQTITHSYPHCWRCHQPTIFRATEQWFIGMEREQLRAKTLEAIKNVKWYPAWGEDRMTNMIASRPDWCISRQRVWGVPIVVFYCESCNEPFTEKAVLEHVVDLFREHTADVWYSRSAAELMGPGHKCGKCGGESFRKETDILDVWFDSGSSHLAVLTAENDLPWPADMYLEGGDQYRGWFHSSLLVGVGLKGSAPYKGCATHGWTLDADGRAMSKSVGNGIEPEEIVKKYGSDILRLWTASVDFTEDVRLSDVILTRLSEAYRKIRNTFRYALGNLHDFDPETQSVPGSELLEIDQWILTKAEELVRKCRASYDGLAFHSVYRAVYDFAVTDLSAVYFDVLKDRLYASAPGWRERRSGQTAMYRVHVALTRLLAPLLSFTCEEVWQHTKRGAAAADSIHLDYFPEPGDLTEGIPDSARGRMAQWDALIGARNTVLKSLDDAREQKLIGSSLEAAVTLEAGGETLALLKEYEAQLPALFIVSQVELKTGNSDGVAVTVERTRGDKCERCWRYTLDVGKDEDFPTICLRCAAAVKEILE